MKKIFLLLVLFLPFGLVSQVIPVSQRVEWEGAGFEGTVPSPQNIVDVSTFGALANDGIDDHAAVVSAINSLGGNLGVVFFPPGNYNLLSPITLPDSVILRGSGSASTTLVFNFNNSVNNCINVIKGQPVVFAPLISGYQKDSRSIVVANASLNFIQGEVVEIRETNGSWDTNPASWADNSVGHISSVDSVNGDTIYLKEALRINFTASLNPEVRKITPRTYCGLECFSMTRIDSTAASVNYGVYFSYAANCWMDGMEVYKTIGAQVFAEASYHISIKGSYFHDAYLFDGASTRGYGVALAVHTGSCLVENNIFKHLRHAMMVKQGANGNVFGYNYSLEPTRSEPINDFSGDISLHGHYPFANLFEGNVVQNIIIDQAWGPSGPYNTFFRNRAELYGLIMSSGTVQSDTQNFAGNDIPNTGLFMGLYVLNGTGHFEHGNHVQGTITPPGTQVLADTSYYLTSTPSFWNIPNAFPTIGTPNAPGGTIPALERYTVGNYTVCNSAVITGFDNQISNEQESVSNVFFSENEISFTVNNVLPGPYQFILYDILGKNILQQQLIIKSDTEIIQLPVSQNVAEGLYVGSFYNSIERLTFKSLK